MFQVLARAASVEQQRLSYELHDGLGQELTGIQFLLSSIAKRLQADRPGDATELESVIAHVRQTIETTRRISQGLMPPSLTRGDLWLSIQDLAADVSRFHGMCVECSAERWTPGALSESTAQHLYRITQEALTNARRHGHARRANVVLRITAQALEVSVTDDGCGIPEPLPDNRGIGLSIMAHRARTIGAALGIERHSEGGTRVTVHCPLAVKPENTQSDQ